MKKNPFRLPPRLNPIGSGLRTVVKVGCTRWVVGTQGQQLSPSRLEPLADLLERNFDQRTLSLWSTVPPHCTRTSESPDHQGNYP
jgi:hypothetical protein